MYYCVYANRSTMTVFGYYFMIFVVFVCVALALNIFFGITTGKRNVMLKYRKCDCLKVYK